MLKPTATTYSRLFWKHYSRYMLHRHFHQVCVTKSENFVITPQKSILLLGNHFSWWDGFIGNYLSHEISTHKFHVMMLEEQLQKNKILQTSGAFSIQRNSRDMVRSLQFATQVLENHENLLLLYPQGRIESMHNPTPTFEKGWFRIVSQLKTQATQIVFYTALVDYMQHEKPTLYLNLAQYNGSFPYDFETLKIQFLTHYETCREKQSVFFC
jgi:1-acyl-sn-glycerol-3-phosphate acyltransferase